MKLRRLHVGRKVMTNLDSIIKSRDITLSTKICVVRAMIFPVVMYGCGSWTIKKAECWRVDAFQLWCWRRLLRVPWPSRSTNQSILKETSPGCSLEGLTLRLQLQIFGHLMRRVDSLEKTLVLGGIEGRSRRGQQRMRWLDGITEIDAHEFGWTLELVMDSEVWRPPIHWVAKNRTQLRDWTDWLTVQEVKSPNISMFQKVSGDTASLYPFHLEIMKHVWSFLQWHSGSHSF